MQQTALFLHSRQRQSPSRKVIGENGRSPEETVELNPGQDAFSAARSQHRSGSLRRTASESSTSDGGEMMQPR
jgi:hypothetical protein